MNGQERWRTLTAKLTPFNKNVRGTQISRTKAQQTSPAMLFWKNTLRWSAPKISKQVKSEQFRGAPWLQPWRRKAPFALRGIRASPIVALGTMHEDEIIIHFLEVKKKALQSSPPMAGHSMPEGEEAALLLFSRFQDHRGEAAFNRLSELQVHQAKLFIHSISATSILSFSVRALMYFIEIFDFFQVADPAQEHSLITAFSENIVNFSDGEVLRLLFYSVMRIAIRRAKRVHPFGTINDNEEAEILSYFLPNQARWRAKLPLRLSHIIPKMRKTGQFRKILDIVHICFLVCQKVVWPGDVKNMVSSDANSDAFVFIYYNLKLDEVFVDQLVHQESPVSQLQSFSMLLDLCSSCMPPFLHSSRVALRMERCLRFVEKIIFSFQECLFKVARGCEEESRKERASSIAFSVCQTFAALSWLVEHHGAMDKVYEFLRSPRHRAVGADKDDEHAYPLLPMLISLMSGVCHFCQQEGAQFNLDIQTARKMAIMMHFILENNEQKDWGKDVRKGLLASSQEVRQFLVGIEYDLKVEEVCAMCV